MKEKQVISIVGAGGKTTRLWQLANAHASKGEKVLVLTSTHMGVPKIGCVSTAKEIKKLFVTQNLVAGGIIEDHKGKQKMSPLPETERKLAITEADFVVIEADGARQKLFKVPYSQEPVIVLETTKILIMVAVEAAGHSVLEACYNPEGICAILNCSNDYILTEQDLLNCTKATYERLFRKKYPKIPYEIVHREDDLEIEAIQ